ncbi:MAG: hypothetical protein WBW03_21685 [Silvibacterium sp.]
MVRARIDALDDDELCAQVLRAHIAHVEPRIFMIYEKTGRYQIIVHHFDRPAFDEHWQAGRLGPHYHHFSFTTRLLRGAYYNWIYDNEGDLNLPQLRLSGQVRCEQGDVYTLPFDRFHCVLLPDHDTVSLMVRGRPVLDPGHPPDPNYGKSEILELRNRLLQLLQHTPQVQPGRIRSLPSAPGERSANVEAPHQIQI